MEGKEYLREVTGTMTARSSEGFIQIYKVMTKRQLEQRAYQLFPVDPEYDSEPYEDGSYRVIDMNEHKRWWWIEDRCLENNPPLPKITELF
jgi:hypothetical protein